MNELRLKRRINFLTGYVLISSVIFMVLIFSAFKNGERKESFDEITVKRINVVDETGENLRMVISNEKRQHPGIINGEILPERERPSGIIFFNSSGDECGGLVYDGNEQEAGMVFSIDKFRDDQVMQLQYMEDTKKYERKYGLQIWDYPKENTFKERMNRFKELEQIQDDQARQLAYQKMKLDSLLMEERLFIGKKFNKDVGLFINDQNGIPRIKIYIDNDDNPKIELLDKEGKVIKDNL